MAGQLLGVLALSPLVLGNSNLCSLFDWDIELDKVDSTVSFDFGTDTSTVQLFVETPPCAASAAITYKLYLPQDDLKCGTAGDDLQTKHPGTFNTAIDSVDPDPADSTKLRTRLTTSFTSSVVGNIGADDQSKAIFQKVENQIHLRRFRMCFDVRLSYGGVDVVFDRVVITSTLNLMSTFTVSLALAEPTTPGELEGEMSFRESDVDSPEKQAIVTQAILEETGADEIEISFGDSNGSGDAGNNGRRRNLGLLTKVFYKLFFADRKDVEKVRDTIVNAIVTFAKKIVAASLAIESERNLDVFPDDFVQSNDDALPIIGTPTVTFPDPDGDTEIFNFDLEVDTSVYQFRCEKDGDRYVEAPNTVLSPNSLLTICVSPTIAELQCVNVNELDFNQGEDSESRIEKGNVQNSLLTRAQVQQPVRAAVALVDSIGCVIESRVQSDYFEDVDPAAILVSGEVLPDFTPGRRQRQRHLQDIDNPAYLAIGQVGAMNRRARRLDEKTARFSEIVELENVELNNNLEDAAITTAMSFKCYLSSIVMVALLVIC